MPNILTAPITSHLHNTSHPDTTATTTANDRSNDDDDAETTTDDEYARFVKSLMLGKDDGHSIMTFKTLQSATTHATDAGTTMVGGGDESGTGGRGVNLGTIVGDESMIGSAFYFDDLDFIMVFIITESRCLSA